MSSAGALGQYSSVGSRDSLRYELNSPVLGLGCKVEGGADVALEVGVWQRGHNCVLGPPPGAVAGNDVVRGEGGEVLDGLRDDAFEYSAGEVHAADEGVNVVYSGEAAGVLEHVDGAGVAAARHDY